VIGMLQVRFDWRKDPRTDLIQRDERAKGRDFEVSPFLVFGLDTIDAIH
jgi:hypothetical protein